MRGLRLSLFVLFAFGFLFAVLNPVHANADSSSSVAAVTPDTSLVEQSKVSALLEVLPDWLQALSVLIAAAAGIAALTPSPKDDSAFLILRKIIDLLALNFGGAKNANSSKTDKYLN